MLCGINACLGCFWPVGSHVAVLTSRDPGGRIGSSEREGDCASYDSWSDFIPQAQAVEPPSLSCVGDGGCNNRRNCTNCGPENGDCYELALCLLSCSVDESHGKGGQEVILGLFCLDNEVAASLSMNFLKVSDFYANTTR